MPQLCKPAHSLGLAHVFEAIQLAAYGSEITTSGTRRHPHPSRNESTAQSVMSAVLNATHVPLPQDLVDFVAAEAHGYRTSTAAAVNNPGTGNGPGVVVSYEADPGFSGNFVDAHSSLSVPNLAATGVNVLESTVVGINGIIGTLAMNGDLADLTTLANVQNAVLAVLMPLQNDYLNAGGQFSVTSYNGPGQDFFTVRGSLPGGAQTDADLPFIEVSFDAYNP